MFIADSYQLQSIGTVQSTLKNIKAAPKQGFEGGREAWIEINPKFTEALKDLTIHSKIFLLTWLHQSDRDVLKVHPRGNPNNPLTGVFSTRSPNRPNPIGLHPVQILEIAEPNRIKIKPLEVIDGTPVIDIKPILNTDNKL